MAFPRAANIIRHVAPLSAPTLLLATARQTRPWLRPIADFALKNLSHDGRLAFRYERFGRPRQAYLRLDHLDCDLQSALELACGDCYRLATLPEPDLIVDGGANIGLFSLAATARWPNARIIACEPVATNVEVIRNHLALNNLEGSVDVRAVALSGHRGFAKFYVRGANQGSFDPTLPWSSTVEVPLRSLQEILAEHAYQRLLVKLDIEGSECDVLTEFLRNSKPKNLIVVMELHDIQRTRSIIEKLARDNDLALEFFELSQYTGHCQLSSRYLVGAIE